MSANANLHKAKDTKNDEFYTQLTDVSKELMHYKQHFKNKIVFCNCDDPTWSAFWKYFHLNFSELGLKKLISTHYDKEKYTYKMEYMGGDDNNIEVGIKTELECNGDFRNQECLDLMDEADIVVTNPPFSLAREYFACLMEHHKSFLIVGDMNMIAYRELFPYIRDNKIWLGNNSINEFIQPDGTVKKFGNKLWYTNLDIKKRHEDLILWKHYNDIEYPYYDNYDAINVDKVSDIPCDFDGVMGVPLTFLNIYNPDQFEIITIGSSPMLFTATKKYENLLRHNIDGTTTKEHIACNQCLTIAYDTKPSEIYCTASNSDKYLVVPYKRLLIKKKAYK